MTTLTKAVESILTAQRKSGKPLAVIIAGRNGSGKSTMWYVDLADKFQFPLVNADARVSTRVANGGHNVDTDRLVERFPRSQLAIRHASNVADATILTDNSREQKDAFTVCRVQMGDSEICERRKVRGKKPPAILEWMNVVCPL